MDMIFNDLESFSAIQLGASGIALIVYLLLKKLINRVVSKRALLGSFDENRVMVIRRVIRLSALIILIVSLGIIWEVSLKGLSVYVASFLTVVGVGLFATWSIVSNVTASVILFFFFPFRKGSKVKIVDGDNSAEGEVLGLSLFSITIKKEDGKIIYYPNNLAIQKSIIHIG